MIAVQLSDAALEALQSLDALDATGDADHPDFPAVYAYVLTWPLTAHTGEVVPEGGYVRVVEFKTARGFAVPSAQDAIAHVERARAAAIAAGCDELA